MSLRIIKRDPSSEDKEVILEIDATQQGQPSEQTFSVKGTILDYKESPVNGLIIRAFDKGLAGDISLGETTSSESGTYLIYYSSALLPAGKVRADLYVQVFDQAEELLAESVVVSGALTNEIINVSIVIEDFVGASEFALIKEKIDPHMEGVAVDAVDLEGVELLSVKLDVDPEVVSDYLISKHLSASLLDGYSSDQDKRHEVLYGFCRFDLPYESSQLVRTEEAVQREALESVTESNIIDPNLFEDVDQIITALQQDIADDALIDDEADDPQNSPSYFAQLLNLAGLPAVKQVTLYNKFVLDGDEENFWDLVVTDGVLTSGERDTVKFIFQLGVVTQQHVPMVTELYNNANVNSAEDLGDITEAEWLTMIDTTGVPDRPDHTQEEKEEYAESLLTSTEQAFPTRVLKKEIDDDGDFNGTDLKTFVTDNPAFDFKDTSPSRYFVDNPTALQNANDPEEAKKEIRKTRRLWQVLKGKNKMGYVKSLKSNNLSSAAKISGVGRRKFKRKYTPILGDEKEADRLYRRAQKRTAASVATYARFNPRSESLSTRVFKGTPVTETEAAANPELNVFYQSADYCNCTHCRSSQSAAAYLVDLIGFLKEADNSSGVDDALTQLQERRPEIIKLQLSCENTNTTLPYLDLVNEVLEYAVDPTGLPENLSRQTTLDSKTLSAEPEHLHQSAYDILANEVYTWELPFHLWNEEAIAYLDKLGIERSDIVRTSLGYMGQINGIGSAEAAVHLGISSALTSVLNDNSSFTPYYGGANSSQLADISSSNGLLEKTGLSYQELLKLIDTKFVNPNGIEIVFAPASSCKLEDASLAFTSNELKDLHRFVRLQKILGWTAVELDIVLDGFGATNISNSTIIQLSGIKRLSDRFDVSADILATWFAPLSERSYNEQPSQFDEIFLNPVYNTDQAVKDVFSSGVVEVVTASGDLNTDNGPVILGALRAKATDVIKLVEAELQRGDLNKAELSHIYRVVSFTRELKISIQDYLDLKKLFGLQPLTTPDTSVEPNDMLAFLTWYDVLAQARYSVSDLNFLLRHSFETGFISSKEAGLVKLLSDLRGKIQSRLVEKDIGLNKTSEGLLSLMRLFLDESKAVRSVEIVEDGTLSQADEFLDQNWTNLVEDIADVKAKISTTGGSLSDAQERLDFVFEVLHPKLKALLLLEEETVQFLSEVLEISGEIVELLITQLMKEPSDANSALINLFTQFDFVYSTEDIIDSSGLPDHFASLLQLQKVGLVIAKQKINSDRLEFLTSSSGTTNWYNILSFPIVLDDQVSVLAMDQFIKLTQILSLEKEYANVEGFSMIGLIERAIGGAAITELHQALSLGTGWEILDIQYLAGNTGQGFDLQAADYTNEGWLLKLESVFRLQKQLAVSAEKLLSWSFQDVTYGEAQSIVASVKSSYDLTTWYKVGEAVRNGLRAKQRDALSAYLIANNSNFKDTNDLFSYYLLDVEMAPCMITSRIKLAISTLQLWVQRIRMNLEPDITFSDDEMQEWNWRKNYRVWEAARKVFLYPENWIEPELRDDKSPFFKELEEELLQDEVNEQTAERAYLNYLHKLNEVSHLEIAATYKEDENDTMHVFARTKDSPHIYYYRKLVDGYDWSSWEKVDLDIEGDHLIPMVFNRRPMLFWPVFGAKPEAIDESDLKVETSNGAIKKDVPEKIMEPLTEIKLAYSEWSNNKWQPKKISTHTIEFEGPLAEDYLFKAVVNEKGLNIDAYCVTDTELDYEHIGSFFLNNCSGELVVSENRSTSFPSKFSIKNSLRSYQKVLSKSRSNSFTIVESIPYSRDEYLQLKEKVRTHEKPVLRKTPSQFKLTYSIDGGEILSETPFFFEDLDRVFFVKPSDKTFTKNLLKELLPKSIPFTVRKTVSVKEHYRVPIVQKPAKVIPRVIPSPIRPSSIIKSRFKIPLVSANRVQVRNITPRPLPGPAPRIVSRIPRTFR
ncbi:neuraminidase-like domain-containing protein [Reichenbachiella sp.]